MSMFVTELWRIGIIHAPIQQVATCDALSSAQIKWIEAEKPLCFLADPFGVWCNGMLHVFAELYDYRTRKGEIVVYVLDAHFNLVEHRSVLVEPWHLSYPNVFEADGEIWMLPEGYKSGRLNLYRAIEFPWSWERVPEFSFPTAAIDASPIFINDSWWMFYTPPEPKPARTSALMLARSDTLSGPWENIAEHPIHTDKAGARMGGTPFIQEDNLVLPTQDCTRTYGGGLRLLSIPLATLHAPAITSGTLLEAPASSAPFVDGLHTLSAVKKIQGNPHGPLAPAEEVTLIDTKRLLRGSPRRMGIDMIRSWKKRHA